jgi:hypothetical protein
MVQDGRYHRQVFWPVGDLLPGGSYRLETTRHAELELENDRYAEEGDELPQFIQVRPEEVFEVTMERGRLRFMVVRTAYDADRDMVLVLRPRTRSTAVVITTWFNLNDDQHVTLDRTKYVTEGSK